jgi:hypothetical protein
VSKKVKELNFHLELPHIQQRHQQAVDHVQSNLDKRNYYILMTIIERIDYQGGIAVKVCILQGGM